jgi:hypothetical protein
MNSEMSRFSAALSSVEWSGALAGGFGCAVRAPAPAARFWPNMISPRRLLRVRPAASPSLAMVSTSAASRTMTGTPSSMRVTGRPVTASSTGRPSISDSYDATRPVPAVVALRSSLAGSVWQPVQVLRTPRSRVHSGWMCSG